MFRTRPSMYASALRMTFIILSVTGFWISSPSTVLGQAELEPPPWYGRLLSEFGGPDSPLLKSERQVQEHTLDVVDKVHEHFQKSIDETSAGAQMKALEPAIVAETRNENVALVEVQMRANSNGVVLPFVFIWGEGRDFTDAFINGNPGPVLSRDVPDTGMIDFDDSYFVLAYGVGGKAHFDTPYPEGWNQGTTRAERDQLALRLAEPYRYYAQCTIAAANAGAKAAQLARNASPSQNTPEKPSGPSTKGPTSEARPRNPPQRPEIGDHTGSDSEGNRGTEAGGTGGGGGAGAGAGGGTGRGEGGRVIEIEPPSKILDPRGGMPDREEDLVGRTPLQRLQEPGVVAQSSPPQNSSPASEDNGPPCKFCFPGGDYEIRGGNGTIKGSVSDPRGAPLRILVRLKSAVHGTADYMYTDANGQFIFPLLPTGPNENYSLSVDGHPHYSSIEVLLLVNQGSPVKKQFTLQPRTVDGDMNWGLRATRAWVDLNGTGEPDFCRILPQLTPTQGKTGPKDESSRDSDVLACDLSSGFSLQGLYEGIRASIPVPTEARTDNFAWVHFHDTQHLDFCRAVPTSIDRRTGKLVCILWEGHGFGKTVSTPDNQPINLGIPSGRAWVDLDGDGKADFCTLIVSAKLEHQLACWLSKGDKFSDTPIVSYDVHWPADPKFRAWVDVNADGKTDFCSVQGAHNEFFECVLSNGREFESPIRDLIRPPIKP